VAGSDEVLRGGEETMKSVNTGLGQEIKVMDFRNPVFKEGLNLTIRFGEKWKALKIGEKFNLTSGESAICEELIVCRFKDISFDDLGFEHDPKCRTKVGLLDCLYGIYPEMSITKENSVVTLVFFTII